MVEKKKEKGSLMKGCCFYKNRYFFLGSQFMLLELKIIYHSVRISESSKMLLLEVPWPLTTL